MEYTYTHSIVGGTFDNFHKGHKMLLTQAFEHSEHVTIGITQEKMYAHKLLASFIERYDYRKQTLLSFLRLKNYLHRATVIPLTDIYGISLENTIDAIFVTHSNLPNVRIINAKRKQNHLPPLSIVLVPSVKGDDNRVITSQRIRLGEIDRTGHSFKQLFKNKHALSLPESKRDAMRKPLGEVVKNIREVTKKLKEVPFVIAVGDIVSLSLIKNGQQAAVSIVDKRTRRHTLSVKEKDELIHSSKSIHIFNNKAGTIHTRVVEGILKAIKHYALTNNKQTIIIRGEEDLLSLPAILFAPLGSIVLYGQADIGVVVNYVTLEKKNEVSRLISLFQ